EIENYLCSPRVLLSYAEQSAIVETAGPLFSAAHVLERTQAMEASIAEVETAMRTLRKGSPWSPDTKVTDDFLDPLFEIYFKKLKLPNLMRKTDYHELARLVPKDAVDKEIAEVLDRIVLTAKRAKPKS
ncbi:MAG: hypothetical protein WBG02_04840, partial [Candidatus Acidiferrum sp.]